MCVIILTVHTRVYWQEDGDREVGSTSKHLRDLNPVNTTNYKRSNTVVEFFFPHDVTDAARIIRHFAFVDGGIDAKLSGFTGKFGYRLSRFPPIRPAGAF